MKSALTRGIVTVCHHITHGSRQADRLPTESGSPTPIALSSGPPTNMDGERDFRHVYYVGREGLSLLLQLCTCRLYVLGMVVRILALICPAGI